VSHRGEFQEYGKTTLNCVHSGTRKRRVLQGKSRQVGRVGADALSWLAGRLPNILFLECFFLLGRGDTILGMSSRGERDERETVLHQTL